MGREIRRVPENWNHPRYTPDTAYQKSQIDQFIPLNDNLEKALEEFAQDIKTRGLQEAIDYWGGGPQSENYAFYGASH